MSDTDYVTLARTAFLDNASYEANGSVSQCKLFMTACRQLLLLLPKLSATDRSSAQFSPELIREELEQARRFLAGSSDSPGGGTGRYLATDGLRGVGLGSIPDPVLNPDTGGG